MRSERSGLERQEAKSLPIVSAPGPDCFHPGRLCVVSDLKVCPHALTPFAHRSRVHSLTRCARELPRELTAHEIAEQLGLTESRVHQIIREALVKLRRRAARWRE